MKENNEYLGHLREIRRMMEKSSKFLSLSGLSGILAGIYALIAASIAHFIYTSLPAEGRDIKIQLLVLALTLLLVSLVTSLVLTIRRARQVGLKPWGPGSRQLLSSLSIPLVTGGIFALILLFRETEELILPCLLLFYGLALVSASRFTHREIYFMGMVQIVLGLLAAIFSSIGLLLWAAGFGIVHIVYGIVMYFRYERNLKNKTE